MKTLIGTVGLLALVVDGPSLCAKSINPCATTCRTALHRLVQAGHSEIPPSSTCYADYGQRGRPTVSTVLANELAEFGRGDNSIDGGCDADVKANCVLNIRHRYGEDVSSLTIKFRLVADRVVIGSLQCISTP